MPWKRVNRPRTDVDRETRSRRPERRYRGTARGTRGERAEPPARADRRVHQTEPTVTEGNLATHIERTEDAGYVAVDKRFVDRKPRTTYRLTDRGEELFEDHIHTLEALIDDPKTDES